MPNARQTGHRLRLGTFTSSGITSTYAIENWALQSDQSQDNQINVPWVAPYQAKPPDFARKTNSADLSTRYDGPLTWEWDFSYWTFGMTAYLISTFFGGSIYTSAGSVAVSGLTYDVSDTAIYFNASLERPSIKDALTPEYAGFKTVKLTFTAGVLVS
jgi:hypothetical protein